jgi:hypothetical protein
MPERPTEKRVETQTDELPLSLAGSLSDIGRPFHLKDRPSCFDLIQGSLSVERALQWAHLDPARVCPAPVALLQTTAVDDAGDVCC